MNHQAVRTFKKNGIVENMIGLFIIQWNLLSFKKFNIIFAILLTHSIENDDKSRVKGSKKIKYFEQNECFSCILVEILLSINSHQKCFNCDRRFLTFFDFLHMNWVPIVGAFDNFCLIIFRFVCINLERETKPRVQKRWKYQRGVDSECLSEIYDLDWFHARNIREKTKP